MKLKYIIGLPNNKDIPLIVNCSIFTFLRLSFKKVKYSPFICNASELIEHNNIMALESYLTFDRKNNSYTSKCVQLYISLDYTDSVAIDISYDGTVSALISYYDSFKSLDEITKSLVEGNEVYIYSSTMHPDNIDILKDRDKLELEYLGPIKGQNTNKFILRYKNEYRPELYY